MKLLNTEYAVAPIDSLIEHPDNPRSGNQQAIEESLAENGIYGVAVVQKSTRHILVGNHRVKKSRQAGATEFPVVFVDIDDEAALALLMADNKTSDHSRGSNDNRILLSVVEQVKNIAGSLRGTCFGERDLEKLRAAVGQSQAPPPPPPDSSSAPAEQPVYANVMISVGDVKFMVTKQEFDRWSLELRKQHGFNPRQVKQGILQRLGISAA